jgi:hypothetical protein
MDHCEDFPEVTFSLPTHVAHLALLLSVSTPGPECYVEGVSLRSDSEFDSGEVLDRLTGKTDTVFRTVSV